MPLENSVIEVVGGRQNSAAPVKVHLTSDGAVWSGGHLQRGESLNGPFVLTSLYGRWEGPPDRPQAGAAYVEPANNADKDEFWVPSGFSGHLFIPRGWHLFVDPRPSHGADSIFFSGFTPPGV